MRLKKIALSGFKSFADKTTLTFDFGITCIVGPNGCGKSNIADAFRWVLGEQSAKSMRGSKMQDVLFAGTSHRKPVNLAEVSLTFTDIQSSLPTDYEEITITRRLHRDGESEYLLNGNQVRLKDIQSLFMDSGVGAEAFSIFEQGKMDEIIRFSPIERRAIFEEAAGIVRFLQRKQEAIKRLEQVKNNIDRAKDIHLEVEKQISSLTQQAEEARKFQEQKALLEVLEKDYFAARWKQLEKKQFQSIDQKDKHEINLKKLNENLKDIQTNLSEILKELNQKENDRQTKREELIQISGHIEMGSKDNMNDQERFDENREKQKRLKVELEKLQQPQKQENDSIRLLKERLIELETSLQNHGETYLGDQVQEKEEALKEKQQLYQALLQKRMKLSQDDSKIESEIKLSYIRLENNEEKIKHHDSNSKFLVEDLNKLESSIKEKEEQLQKHSQLAEAHQIELKRLNDEIGSISKLISQTESQLQKTINNRHVLDAKRKILIKMRDEHEGFSIGSKKLLEDSLKIGSPIHKMISPLFEQFSSSSISPHSLAARLRHYAHTLLVDTFVNLEIVLKRAEELKLHDYSILCKESIQTSLEEHFLRKIDEVEKHSQIIDLIKQPSQNEVWSHQGGWLDSKKVFFSFKSGEQHPFLREAEIESLNNEILNCNEEESNLSEQLENNKTRKSKLVIERESRDKFFRDEEFKKIESGAYLQRYKSDLSKVKQDISKRHTDYELLSKQSDSLREILKNLNQSHNEIKIKLADVQEEISIIEKALSELQQVLRYQQKDLKEWEESGQKWRDEQKHCLHKINLHEVREQERLKNEFRINKELEDLDEVQQSLLTKMENRIPHMQKLANKKEVLAELLNTLQQNLQSLINKKFELEVLQNERQGEIRKRENDIQQCEIQLAQISASREAIESELTNNFNMTIDHLLSTSKNEEVSIDKLDKQIKSIKRNLNETASVNIGSIEELERYKERHLNMTSQIDDLNQSKDEIFKIISQLDSESRKLFLTTFETVRNNFKKNFQILFQGGEADLQLTNEGQILEAGIEIIAKPPGKQMKSMSLLSGGEKCLTAVALLFSIFEVKPSPFCILDEIDAPLDDANVGRFVNVVKHFADKCQFLIITHNKNTMSIGDVLCGVSMEEKGVSKLLSLEFAKN